MPIGKFGLEKTWRTSGTGTTTVTGFLFGIILYLSEITHTKTIQFCS